MLQFEFKVKTIEKSWEKKIPEYTMKVYSILLNYFIYIHQTKDLFKY
jgi:hypothetical protein